MGRRSSYNNVPRLSASDRESIGDRHVSSAIDRLQRLQRTVVSQMTAYTPSLEDTVTMLFTADDLCKLRAVKGMVETAGFKKYELYTGCSLQLDYRGATVPAIEPAALSLQPTSSVLLAHIVDVKEIHNKFEAVKGLLRWLNRNATASAIRYYFPQAMNLCPDAPVWRDLQELPKRFDTPAGIGAWGQVIRDASTTLAAAALLPSDAKPKDPRSLGSMSLSFSSQRVDLTSDQFYATDQMTYHL